jgi:hypothetical protein
MKTGSINPKSLPPPLILLLASLTLFVGCMKSPKTADRTAQETPAIRVDASTLYAEYQANQVAADQKYKGKVVVVSGIIDRIGKDLLDQTLIHMGKSSLAGVDFTFVKSDSSSIANLKKGQTVSVKGRIDGELLTSVMLKDCTLQ